MTSTAGGRHPPAVLVCCCRGCRAMVATVRDRDNGVPVGELRAAVALARLHTDGGGVVWSAAEWERVWSHLTPGQQRVVYLHILVGLTHTEVADQLGITRGSVDGAWRRALARIRDALPGSN